MSRLDRVLVILAFVLALSIVFAAAAAFGSLGPFELLIALVIAVPLSIPLFRFLRAWVARSRASA